MDWCSSVVLKLTYELYFPKLDGMTVIGFILPPGVTKKHNYETVVSRHWMSGNEGEIRNK